MMPDEQSRSRRGYWWYSMVSARMPLDPRCDRARDPGSGVILDSSAVDLAQVLERYGALDRASNALLPGRWSGHTMRFLGWRGGRVYGKGVQLGQGKGCSRHLATVAA